MGPSLSDPRINTAECVITGHEKASHFPGLKQLLHGVCWSLLIISLVTSLLASQWLIVQLRNWHSEKNQSKIAAVMFLSLIVFFGGLCLNIYAFVLTTGQQDLYVCVFLGSLLFVLFRRAFWCIKVHYTNILPGCLTERIVKLVKTFHWHLGMGHGEYTSTNFFSCFTLYPAVFMACHHVLWILLGIITEPFWGITVLVAVVSVSAALFFLAYEFHKSFASPEKSLEFYMSVILISAAFFAFVLAIMVLFVVAQAFLSESLVSAIVQNVLVGVATVWYSYMKRDAGGGGGGGGGGERQGQGEEGEGRTLRSREGEERGQEHIPLHQQPEEQID